MRFVIFFTVLLSAMAASAAPMLPAGLEGLVATLAVCGQESDARYLVGVRAYGAVVAEDALQILNEQASLLGSPKCGTRFVDMRKVSHLGSVDLGVVEPIDSAPFRATLVEVADGSDKFWILWFTHLEST